MADSRDYRQELTARVIAALEAGTAPWQKPWNPEEGELLVRPTNPITGNPYRGINALNLMMVGYSDPRWCTYKQAQAAGWQVRRGEKGMPIEYWKFHDSREVEDPDTHEKRRVTAELERPRVFYATVFNLSQMDNAPALEHPAPEWDVELLGDGVIRNCGVPVLHDQANRAFYISSRDEIHAPPRSAFPTARQYYATIFHEIGHSTGHETRLKRELGRSFGSPEYAKEELRAELASLFVAGRLGLPFEVGNHAAYVGSWIKALEGDKNEIFRAARDAEKIADYVLALGKELELAVPAEDLSVLLPSRARMAIAATLGTGATLSRAVGAGETVGTVVWADHSVVVQQVGAAQAVVHDAAAFEPGAFDDDGADRPYKWNSRRAAIRYEAKGATLHYAGAPERSAVEELESRGRGPGIGAVPDGADDKTGRGARGLPPEERIYLFVPYAQRAEASRLGAVWDAGAKAWYVGVDRDMAPFERWLKVPTFMTPDEVIGAFRNECERIGLNMTEDPEMDGIWHATTVTTSRNAQKKSGAYVLNDNGYGMVFNHDTGMSARFEPEGRVVEDAQAAAQRARYAENLAKHRVDEQAKKDRRAADCERYYAGLTGSEAIAGGHPYLGERKQVPAFDGVRRDGDLLVIPMFDGANRVRNVQKIDPSGVKRYAKGAEKKGRYFVIGDLAAADTILFGEGYATLASPHLATGFPTVVCFDSGNIGAVMAELKERIAHADRIILCDNDLVTSERLAETLTCGAMRDRVGYPEVTPDDVEKALAGNGAVVLLGDGTAFGLTVHMTSAPEHYELPRLYAEVVSLDGGEIVHRVMINNVGLEKGLAAAEAHGAKAVAPRFADPEAYRNGFKDFNDLHRTEGLGRVALELAAVVDLVKGRRTVEAFAQERKYNLVEFVEPQAGGRYTGMIVGNVGVHAVQETRRGDVVAHPIQALDCVPGVGDNARIGYREGLGQVSVAQAREKVVER